jgi:hypothetical protein
MDQRFVVLDAAGQPVAGALLQATSPNGPWQALTDADGTFTAGLGDGPYHVTASKDGIASLPVAVSIGPVVLTLGAVPPPPAEDAIDLSQVVLTAGSPDVRRWPIGAILTRFGLSASVNATIEFTKRNGPGSWPFVPGPEGGPIQYTLWVCCRIGGIWYGCGAILCISRAPDDNYVPTGPTLQPGHLPSNWYYFAGDPLARYQPQPGEQVAWFLTAGVQRRQDTHLVAERTQVMLAPFSEGVYP